MASLSVPFFLPLVLLFLIHDQVSFLSFFFPSPFPLLYHFLNTPSSRPSTMKTSPIVALGVASFLGVLPSQTQTCASLDNVQITFFGYPDNSPPGAGIAWTDCGHSLAGGTGSYDDPITFATAPDGDFQVCDIVYLPYLRKYARYEDDCEQCSKSFTFTILPFQPSPW